MKLLHISDIVNINGNGVSVAMSYYLKYEKKYADVALYNLKCDFDCDCDKVFNKKDYNSIDLLPDGFDKPDLVIFNEVYKKEYLKIYKYCLKNKIPYVIIPHGCLVDVAQKNKKIKKTIGNILFFNGFIKNAIAIQFLNEIEKNNTKFKYKNSIISGNGVDKFNDDNITKEFKNIKIVYIGRYSVYHKGLDALVEVCQKNSNWFRDNNIKIDLYGRESSNDLEVLNALIDKYNIGDVLIINGPIYGQEKEEILNKAYCFIQTSRHEGQPMGIVEAMALGVPCIVTEGTNFSTFINDYECGIGVPFDTEKIFDAIKKICSDTNLRNMYAVNSVKYTKKYFSWNEIIEKVIKDYKKLVEGNEKNE